MQFKPWFIVVMVLAILLGWLTGSLAAFIVAVAICFLCFLFVIAEAEPLATIFNLLVLIDFVVNLIWAGVKHLH